MHRVDGPGATAQNLFTEGTPGAVEATTVGADILNSMQEEIASTVEASGQILDKSNNGQLALAIQTLTGGAPAFRNLFDNGDIQVRQRGGAFGAVSGRVVTADRWGADNISGSIGSFTGKISTTNPLPVPPGNLGYWVSFGPAAAAPGPGTYASLSQRIPGAHVQNGRTSTLSFWISINGETTPGTYYPQLIDLEIIQHFGTGGSPSGDVTTPIGSQLTIPRFSPQGGNQPWTRIVETVDVPTTTGKTFGTNGDDYIEVKMTSGLGGGSFANVVCHPKVTDLQFEDGPSGTAYQRLPYSAELLRCLPFFQTSYAPFDVVDYSVDDGAVRAYAPSGTTPQGLDVRFGVPMRAVPTVTWYNPATGTVDTLEQNAVAKTVSSTAPTTVYSTGYPTLSTSGGAGYARAHFTADAEL